MKTITCNLCLLKCNIKNGGLGLCRVIANDNGNIVNLHERRALFANVSSIENLPLYHFYPGSIVFTLWTIGCPIRCNICPHKALSGGVEDSSLRTFNIRELIELFKKQKAKVFMIGGGEVSIHTNWLGPLISSIKEHNIPLAMRTLGLISNNNIDYITRTYDAILVELITPLLKYSNVKIDYEPIEYTYDRLLRSKLHVEVIVPYVYNGISFYKRDKLLKLISSISPDVPLHIVPYVEVEVHELYRLREAIAGLGFKYVYIPRDPLVKYMNTYCWNCKRIVLERGENGLIRSLLTEHYTCPYCGSRVKIYGDINVNRWKVRRLLLEEIVW